MWGLSEVILPFQLAHSPLVPVTSNIYEAEGRDIQTVGRIDGGRVTEEARGRGGGQKEDREGHTERRREKGSDTERKRDWETEGERQKGTQSKEDK